MPRVGPRLGAGAKRTNASTNAHPSRRLKLSAARKGAAPQAADHAIVLAPHQTLELYQRIAADRDGLDRAIPRTREAIQSTRDPAMRDAVLRAAGQALAEPYFVSFVHRPPR